MSDKITITNVSPQGALDVPLLHRVVAAGETVEVTEAQAHALLAQAVWKAEGKDAEKIERAAKRKARHGRAIALTAPKPTSVPADTTTDTTTEDPATPTNTADEQVPTGSQDKE